MTKNHIYFRNEFAISKPQAALMRPVQSMVILGFLEGIMQAQRVTPAELKAKIMQYHQAKSEPMTEEELSSEIDRSAIARYQVGDNLLSEVQETLRNLAKELPEGAARNEAVFAISKIDEAAQEIVYCALGMNKSMPFVKPALHMHAAGRD